MAIGSGIAHIKKFHGPEIDLSALENHSHPIVQAEVLSQRGRKPFMDKGIDLIVLLTENLGMIRIGGIPFIPKMRMC
jgi:hypothetical protein